LGGYTSDSLTNDQDSLRQFYSTLLKLSKDHPAIADGDYLDATSSLTISVPNKLTHAFFRWTENERLLIISSFAARPSTVRLDLTNFLDPIQIDTARNLSASDLLGHEILSEFSGAIFSIEMPAYGSYVLKIEQQ
jgi:hypothetical protein